MKRFVRCFFAATFALLLVSPLGCLKMSDEYRLEKGRTFVYEMGIRFEMTPSVTSNIEEIVEEFQQNYKKTQASINGTLHMEVNQINSDGTAMIHLRARDLNIQVKQNGRKVYLSAFQEALEDGLHVIRMDSTGRTELIDGPVLPRKGMYSLLADRWDATLNQLFVILPPGRLASGRTWEETIHNTSTGMEEIKTEDVELESTGSFLVKNLSDQNGNSVAEITTTLAADHEASGKDQGFRVKEEVTYSSDGTAFFDTSAGWISASKQEHYFDLLVNYDGQQQTGYGMSRRITADFEIEINAIVVLKLQP